MVNEIFLVTGCCDHEVLSEVRMRIEEKLNAVDETAVRFVDFDRFQMNPGQELDQLRNMRDPDSTANRSIVNVIAVFDGGLEEARRMREAALRLRHGMDEDGTKERYLHLIWMGMDGVAAEQNYKEIISTLYRDLETNRIMDEKCFDYVYFLSDRHSDLSIDASSRVDGAALLLAMLMLSGYRPAGGFYTAGVGKRSISSAEMKRYARNGIAQAIINGTIRHRDQTSALYAGAFGCADMAAAMSRCVETSVDSEFCFISGEGGQGNLSTPVPADEQKMEGMMQLWQKTFLNNILETPFGPFDAEKYFTQDTGLTDGLQKAEAVEKKAIADAASPVRVPLLGEKKSIIQAFNQFVAQRQTAQLSTLQKLTQKWEDYADSSMEQIRAEKDAMTEKLQQFCCSTNFINKCKKQAESITEQVERHIMELDYDTIARGIRFGRENMDEALDQLIRLCEEKVTEGVTDEAMIREVPNMSLDALKTQILDDLDRQSNNLMAAMSHGDQVDMSSVRRFYFMPESLHSKMQVSLERVLNHQSKPIIAEDHRYQNLEELVLVPVGRPLQMTAFNTTLSSSRKAESQYTVAKPTTTAGLAKEKSGQQDSEEDQSEDRNPWKITVDGSGQMRFNWKDSTVKLISCQITDDTGSLKNVSIDKGEFMMKGCCNISRQIGYGSHVIQLWVQGACVSEYTFVGRRHTVELQCESDQIQISKEKSLHRFVVTVASADGISENQADGIICQNLALALDNEPLQLPYPDIRKKKQTWTIVREKDVYPEIIAVNGMDNHYVIQFI